jgi:hypothetical protein
MGITGPDAATPSFFARHAKVILPILAGVVYYLSNPSPQFYYDYTFRIAESLINGSSGLTYPPPEYLNEFVPLDGYFYSVFPLGSVITMLPFAALKTAGVIAAMPGAFIAALCAAVSCRFLLEIEREYEVSEDRFSLMSMGIIFGTFLWANLTMAGAWQLALGFALVGELGAIFFTVFDRRPLLAGLFFAVAFGNRTEVLLTAPVFMYLLYRGDIDKRASVNRVAVFCLVPVALGLATLLYNYVRFQSFTDFGYARIPGVLAEPWYKHGIFSIYYIPRQALEMLWRPWEFRETFPYLVPNGFSSSILWSSPFLLFAFRSGARDRALKYASWLAIAVLTILLWLHGNSGGWQFGYRYAIVLLPWLFVIMLESAPKKATPLEWTAYALSFAANAYATWIFHYTNYAGRIGYGY